MNNNGHGHSANAKPVAPTATHGGHHNEASGSPQKGHVYRQHQGQPNTAHSAAVPIHESSPPRTQYQSRMPIINANANVTNRTAAASAARIPSRTGTGRPGHSRDTSLNVPRGSRVVSSDPLQAAHATKPFWEGSTVDGSVFSDTASIADARAATQPARMQYSEPLVKTRNTPRQHPVKRESDGERLPFVIGDNGLIDVVKRGALTRSSSTPDARAGSKGLPQDSDSYAGDAQYQDSLEKTPPNTLTHHRARYPLRTAKHESFSERTSYPSSAQNGMSSPPDQAYQNPGAGLDYAPREDSDRLRIPDHGPHRSTMFENIDTPLASHPDSDVESESFEEQQTPKPAAATKPTQQPVNRQLFHGSKGSKGQNSLRESSMPRPTSDKPQSTTKKRPFELDYDDSALAAMKYTELRKQAFDFDPAQAESQSAQVPPQGTLPEKLDHFLDKDTNSQANFFTTMSVRDWDDSGDWFLERFGEVMHRLKDARRAKRQLIDDFETEIAEREEAVRNKIHGIGQTLEDLKSEGEILMRGKELD